MSPTQEEELAKAAEREARRAKVEMAIMKDLARHAANLYVQTLVEEGFTLEQIGGELSLGRWCTEAWAIDSARMNFEGLTRLEAFDAYQDQFFLSVANWVKGHK